MVRVLLGQNVTIPGDPLDASVRRVRWVIHTKMDVSHQLSVTLTRIAQLLLNVIKLTEYTNAETSVKIRFAVRTRNVFLSTMWATVLAEMVMKAIRTTMLLVAHLNLYHVAQFQIVRQILIAMETPVDVSYA